jgi:PAS domain S-box-containing protein
MPLFEQPAWIRPESVASPSAAAPRWAGGQAAHFLLSQGVDQRRESRRIAAGLIALAVISVILLNIGILQSARTNLVRQRWGQLADHTEAKREEVRDLLWQFEHQARFVAEQAPMRAWAVRSAAGTLTAEDLPVLKHELERAAMTFQLHAIDLVAADGTPVASSRDVSTARAASDRELAARASAAGERLMAAVPSRAGGPQLLTVAIPLAATTLGRSSPVMLFHADIEYVLLPVLMSWPGFGPTAGAYLVRHDGDAIECLTSPPPNLGLQAGQRLSLSHRLVRPAVIAAEGVESSVEGVDARGRALWTVTRFMPELRWGLVSQVDRDTAMEAMRGTVVGLLVLDMAMVLLALASFWFWRRQYATGLAERETEVTRRHAERVQAIFDTAFDAILTFDRDGRMLAVNRAAESLFGRPAAEIEGQPLHRFLHWGAPGAETPGQLPVPGAVSRTEAFRADGTVLPVELSLGSAGDNEDRLYTAIVRDISERVEAERRIRAFADGLEVSNRRLEELNAQLEEASRLKSEFLANTSHELRTPLNGMIGFLQLVLDGMCDSKDEERDFMKQALQCSRHLLGLINDVLDIAKIEAGKLALEVERVDVRALFDEVYTVTHVQAAQKGITLSFEPPGESGLSVRGDFGKIKQVLINLVGNSLKFTPKGTIKVRASAHPDLGHFMFEVVDSGIGIDPGRQKLIFEKFTQGDGSTTRKYGGTGLGLAISRSLVELMGGIIGAQSDGMGKGTRMYFSLPVWSDAAEAATASNGEPSEQIEGPGGGPVVLIVEDDAAFRHYLKSLLHQNGYRTLEAAHAEGGWVLVRRLQPAIVVLDYALTCPEGAALRTGWDLAERMTSDAKTRHIPLIFVTGFDDELRDKLKSTAFARRPEHLMKPIDGSALLAKIQELLGAIQGRTIRILMADDDPSVAAYVRKVLPEGRFYVEHATNGEQCLHALRTQPRGFDLLLLDLMMPEVSGYDVLREMTLSGVAADLPVLVLTNFPEGRNEEERRLLEQGLVLDVLPKTSVHDNPQLLPHIIDWHLQVASEQGEPAAAPDGEPKERAA